MPLPAQAILAVGVDDGVGGRKVFAHLVMVGDDDVHASLGGDFEGIEACGAAVDRHDELGAIFDQRGDCRRVRPIALSDPVGNVDACVQPVPSEKAMKQRGRRRAIDIVIAEYRDPLTGQNGACRCARRLFPYR